MGSMYRQSKADNKLLKAYREAVEAKDNLISALNNQVSEYEKLSKAQESMINALNENILLNKLITGNHYIEIPTIDRNTREVKP